MQTEIDPQKEPFWKLAATYALGALICVVLIVCISYPANMYVHWMGWRDVP